MLTCRLTIALVIGLAASTATAACGPDALGTSRVLAVDPATTPRVGTKQFPATLTLADKEVVLTFDDGPHPPTTSKILAALTAECARATFFMIGGSALAHPEFVKRMATEGHTIAHHSFSHPMMTQIAQQKALDDIEKGFVADDKALGVSGAAPRTPFFRFPYFASTPALLDAMAARGVVVFGADFWASDWEPMTPEAQLALIIQRLDEARRGIILFHDTKGQTAAMLPAFLRYLKTHGYRVVHIVPAAK